MTVNELYFPVPGRKSFAQGLSLSVIGIGFLAWGVAGMAVTPWSWAGIIPLLGGVLAVGVGLGVILLVWFTFIYGTITIWRRWRQFRPPAVTIDATGVRYLATHRPALIPWPDIEQVHLTRTIFPKRNVTKASLRLAPGAALLREGPVNVPATRYLNIGMMADLDVPEDTAVRFLEDTAGTRLQVTETLHRTAAANSGR